MLVKVVKYQYHWSKEFIKESLRLKNLLSNIVIDIHHIGSTAVPGLMAKPIIDIILEVTDLTDLDHKNDELKKIGYEVMGEFGIPGRRYFRKGGDNRTHQIHAFRSGDLNIKRHLAFRDYLITHPDIAKEYGELKSNIANRCRNDIEKYCDEKDGFVKYYEKKALEWYENKVQ